MSLEWDEVLGRLLRVVEASHGRALDRICVVRDLRGRVRLAIRKQSAAAIDASALDAALGLELGAWFSGPILWTDESAPEVRRLAQSLLQKNTSWPQGWPRQWDDGRGTLSPITEALWCGEERVRSKQSWLAQTNSEPPWPLHERTPAIVSFYSFKGGVGRTTTLGAVARRMAKEGRKVVVIDLDLEAPGAGRFFDVGPERGVLDLLVEHLATGHVDRADLDRHCQSVIFGSSEVLVFPVGQLVWSYIEKLGRLDFAPHLGDGATSPVESALREILKAIKDRYSPDYILLDARAGLHDIGGLTLHALSHLDVLVGRRGKATLDGFELALEAISRRRKREHHRVLMVQTFVPLPMTSDESLAVQEAWRAELWDCVGQTLDRVEDAERPGVSEATARHFPWPVPAFDSIARVDRIQDIDDTTLDSEAFVSIRDRIHERCGRSVYPPTGRVEEGEDDGS